MATALYDLERLAVLRPRSFLVRKSVEDSSKAGNSRLRSRWNVFNVGKQLTLDGTRLEKHERSRRRVVVRAKKDQLRAGGASGNRGDLKLEATDMMELEFGRLLGEDRQTTLAKVVGKKLNPELTYVKIEKDKELQIQKQAARRSAPSKNFATPKAESKLNVQSNDNNTQTFEQGVPDLISPPVRPPGFEKLDASPVRTIRVAPLVRAGGGKKSLEAEPLELEGLIRKPLRVSDSDVGLPPARAEKAVIAPMLMRRNEERVGSQPSKVIDSQIRRPSAVRSNALGDPLSPNTVAPSTSIEDDDIDSYDMSEERFRELLDAKPQGGQGTVSKRSTLLNKVLPPKPLVKPALPTLERKPSIVEKPQLAEAMNEPTHEPETGSSPTRTETSSKSQISDVPDPRPKVSTRPKAKLSQPTLMRPEIIPVVIQTNEVPSGKVEKTNMVEDAATEGEGELEKNTLSVEVKEAISDTISTNDAEDNKEDVFISSAAVKPEIVYDNTESLEVQALDRNASTLDTSPKRPVMRLRKTSLPPQQPVLPVDEESLERSTSRVTSTVLDVDGKDQSKAAAEMPVEEALSDGEQGIADELQERKVTKVGQAKAPGLRLSKPAPPVFINKKPPVVDTTMSTLQKAINSFDEKRVLPNKKEEDEDWARAEALRDSSSVEELQIIGTGRGGLLVGFGSLVGYLPAFELTAKRRPPSFTVWAQSRGYDAQTKEYYQDRGDRAKSMSITESVEPTIANMTQVSGSIVNALEQRNSKAVDPELLEQFKKERAEALSLFVGQKTKVIVVLVDRNLRQLRLSEKQAEGEGQELSQRKITLMESLNVGDTVTCQVKKLTTFGAFVDLQGVPALIHSSELSWNRNTDPLSLLQVGQEVKAKVCKLDRFLQRINLSLKLMQPDPLLETLESLVSPDADMIGDTADVMNESNVTENEELNRFTSKLERIPEIAAVRSGRRVRGSALAPAFQIYLSGPLDNGYKLLARFGNEVQEVLVETSADRERMKDFIRDCTVQDT
ncbi:hypothetical protein MPTK1_2g11640 [Marchantia polymorpha subsp. ruderalis]|uniref:S1 motif domain-containing protein n=1 Tax=Marchantia polymorpha TaxID=3197 RepID=A0A2R6XCJ2_MARPO|nr:hypothetical protein MARPO_0023s0130 [Marchantia polymorpha]BBN01966.1 hypothetical protein Mp_2g11640 [Marchantia polymorpha subsp. ruderalis]|eukprot:PTQ43828.1 hypothetical protein MARPO_0023s0130 [Marchantia polymorpha]